MYGKSVKFLWPYEVRDTYVRNRQTNLYHFSRAFLDQADDLRSYTLETQFFALYPEFKGDAPVYEDVPRLCKSIDLPFDRLWQYFPGRQKPRGYLQDKGLVEEIQQMLGVD